MACELEEAFDEARAALPSGWQFTAFVNGPGGWVVSAAKGDRTAAAVGDLIWYPRIDAKGGTLTKALRRLTEKLLNHAQTETT